jgi:hypothetical protein
MKVAGLTSGQQTSFRYPAVAALVSNGREGLEVAQAVTSPSLLECMGICTGVHTVSSLHRPTVGVLQSRSLSNVQNSSSSEAGLEGLVTVGPAQAFVSESAPPQLDTHSAADEDLPCGGGRLHGQDASQQGTQRVIDMFLAEVCTALPSRLLLRRCHVQDVNCRLLRMASHGGVLG